MVVKNLRHGEEVACSSTLTLRLSTLFHFIVAEEHDKSVVPPYEEAASSFAGHARSHDALSQRFGDGFGL